MRTPRAAIFVLVMLLAAACGSSAAGPGHTAGPTGSTGHGGPTEPPDRFEDQTKIVAIVLGGGSGGPIRPQPKVYVDARYCRIIDADRRGPCRVRPIPAPVRAGVLERVGRAYRFVTRLPQPSRTQYVIALGAPVIRGDAATIAIDSMCGPLCGSGMRIHLHRDGGRWHEVGSRKTDWIS